MNGVVGRKKAQEILFFAAALLFLAWFGGAADLQRYAVTAAQAVFTTAGFLLAAALAPCLIRLADRKGRIGNALSRSETLRLLLLFALAVLPRAAWWLNYPPRIDSDYQLYVRMGAVYAETGQPEMSSYLLTVAPNAVVYSVFTGLLMRVFGTSAMTLVWAAAVLNVCNIMLLYGAGRKITSGARAFAAAAAFALLPENVFYSNTPGIEAPAMFAMLAGLLLVLSGKGRNNRARFLLSVGGSAALAFSASIRPNAWAALIAAAVWLLRDGGAFRRAKEILPRLIPLLVGAALVFSGLQALNAELFTEQRPVSGLGWSLYEGLDLESGGKWTPEKSARCVEVIDAHDPEEADRIFLNEALERYRGYSFPDKIRLFLRKGGSLWYETRYSVFAAEGTPLCENLDHAARTCWAGCIAVCIFGLLYRFRHRGGPGVSIAAGLPLTVLLLTSAWHEIGTSIGRYHYMLIPFLLLLTMIILPGREELNRLKGGPRV